MNHLQVEKKNFDFNSKSSNILDEFTQQMYMKNELSNYNNLVNLYSHCASFSNSSRSRYMGQTKKSNKKSFFISQLLPELFDENNIKQVTII